MGVRFLSYCPREELRRLDVRAGPVVTVERRIEHARQSAVLRIGEAPAAP
jgi:hypothetical protein